MFQGGTSERVARIRQQQRAGHAPPPWMTAFTTERVLVLGPVPQYFVQVPYAVQPDTLQSIGQVNMLQLVDNKSTGHTTPLWFTSVMSDLDVVLDPVPHNFVQVPNTSSVLLRKCLQAVVKRFCQTSSSKKKMVFCPHVCRMDAGSRHHQTSESSKLAFGSPVSGKHAVAACSKVPFRKRIRWIFFKKK